MRAHVSRFVHTRLLLIRNAQRRAVSVVSVPFAIVVVVRDAHEVPPHRRRESLLVLPRRYHRRRLPRAAAADEPALFDVRLELLIPRVLPQVIDDADDELVRASIDAREEGVIHHAQRG